MTTTHGERMAALATDRGADGHADLAVRYDKLVAKHSSAIRLLEDLQWADHGFVGKEYHLHWCPSCGAGRAIRYHMPGCILDAFIKYEKT